MSEVVSAFVCDTEREGRWYKTGWIPLAVRMPVEDIVRPAIYRKCALQLRTPDTKPLTAAVLLSYWMFFWRDNPSLTLWFFSVLCTVYFCSCKILWILKSWELICHKLDILLNKYLPILSYWIFIILYFCPIVITLKDQTKIPNPLQWMCHCTTKYISDWISSYSLLCDPHLFGSYSYRKGHIALNSWLKTSNLLVISLKENLEARSMLYEITLPMQVKQTISAVILIRCINYQIGKLVLNHYREIV